MEGIGKKKKEKRKKGKTDVQLGKQAEAGSRFFFFHCHGFDPYNSALWYASLKKNAKRKANFVHGQIKAIETGFAPVSMTSAVTFPLPD